MQEPNQIIRQPYTSNDTNALNNLTQLQEVLNYSQGVHQITKEDTVLRYQNVINSIDSSLMQFFDVEIDPSLEAEDLYKGKTLVRENKYEMDGGSVYDSTNEVHIKYKQWSLQHFRKYIGMTFNKERLAGIMRGTPSYLQDHRDAFLRAVQEFHMEMGIKTLLSCDTEFGSLTYDDENSIPQQEKLRTITSDELVQSQSEMTGDIASAIRQYFVRNKLMSPSDPLVTFVTSEQFEAMNNNLDDKYIVRERTDNGFDRDVTRPLPTDSRNIRGNLVVALGHLLKDPTLLGYSSDSDDNIRIGLPTNKSGKDYAYAFSPRNTVGQAYSPFLIRKDTNLLRPLVNDFPYGNGQEITSRYCVTAGGMCRAPGSVLRIELEHVARF